MMTRDKLSQPNIWGLAIAAAATALGVALEIDGGGEVEEYAKALLVIANREAPRMYCKRDSSLDRGFELVSYPMSLCYHQQSMPWQDIVEQAVNMGYRSHETNTCGLHVHVNRSSLGAGEAEQEGSIARILYFIVLWLEAYPEVAKVYRDEIDMTHLLSYEQDGVTFHAAYEAGTLSDWMSTYVNQNAEPDREYAALSYDRVTHEQTYYGITRAEAETAGWGAIWDVVVAE